MPRVGSRQASLNKLIWFTLLCYLLRSGDKIVVYSCKVIPFYHSVGYNSGYKTNR